MLKTLLRKNQVITQIFNLSLEARFQIPLASFAQCGCFTLRCFPVGFRTATGGFQREFRGFYVLHSGGFGRGGALLGFIPIQLGEEESGDELVGKGERFWVLGIFIHHRELLAETPVGEVWNLQPVQDVVGLLAVRRPVAEKFCKLQRKTFPPLLRGFVFGIAFVARRDRHHEQPVAIQRQVRMRTAGAEHHVLYACEALGVGREQGDHDIG